MHASTDREWLETDGRGGYASGTSSSIRTRRYHALLLVAATPPTGRIVLVNGFDAWVNLPAGCFALSSQRYTPDVTEPDGCSRIARFEPDPWPRWTFRLADGIEVEQQICIAHEPGAVIVSWRLAQPCAGATLEVRPFVSGRDHHALHHENPALCFDADVSGECVSWQPYAPLPRIVTRSNGRYTHRPEWYRNFQYDEERTRGFDHAEDLASPGVFHWDLSRAEAVWMLAAEADTANRAAHTAPLRSSRGEDAIGLATRWRAAEASERTGPRSLRSAQAYVVRRSSGRTIVAGYPWFTDWGRDTFIALRGLSLATGRLDEAREILVQWAAAVSEGMLPNRFADHGALPEYNSVDAALWFIVAVHDLRRAAMRDHGSIGRDDEQILHDAVGAILDGYLFGTRHGIRCEDDGLLAAGEPGVQLTWMDAITDGHVVTPRIGKPVEVQALWLNALRIGQGDVARRIEALQRGLQAFEGRFWNDAAGCLHDVVDVGHVHGTTDRSMRPNQIFAVGGLPYPLLHGERARRVVDAVEAELLTPLGLRTLAPHDPAYCGRYEGGPAQRDAAYHQGTVWPWLIGPFVEAWVRVRGEGAATRREARERFLAPLFDQLDVAGLGHVSEIADGDAPHTPRGCPFQAWSLGEVLRLDREVLGP